MQHFYTLLFLVVLSSCNAITPPGISSLDSILILSEENGKISTRVSVTLENSNKFKISGRDLIVEVYFRGAMLGQGMLPESFELKAKELTPVSLGMQLFLDSIPDSLRLGLFRMDSIPLTMSLTFQGKLGLEHSGKIAFNLPMDKLQSALVQQYFLNSGFEIKDLKLESTNQYFSIFKGNLWFINTLPFDINILNSEVFVYDQRRNGVNVGQVIIADSLIIKQGEKVLIPTTINVDNMKALSSGFGKILTGALDYFVIGPVHVLLKELPFKVPLAVHFSYNPLNGRVIILEQ